MEYDLVVKGPFIRHRIRPGVCERRWRPMPPQLEHGNVALNRHAPRSHADNLRAQKNCLTVVQELHGSLECRAFGIVQ